MTTWFGIPLFSNYVQDILQIVRRRTVDLGGQARDDLLVAEYLQWVRTDLAENYAFVSAVRRGRTAHRSRLTYMQDPYVRSLHRVMSKRRLAMNAYRTQEYSGRIVLIRAAEPPLEWRFSDKALSWDKVAQGGLEIDTIPGDHMSIIREPNVHKLAEAIQVRLDEATEKAGNRPSK